MKFFIGPMSKNVVDTVLEYADRTASDMTLIPSRRQVDWSGGYVERWTTAKLAEYVKERSKTRRVSIQRDHGGPGQGTLDDDGFESLKHDAMLLQYIHVDPWKKYPLFEDGLRWTIQAIEMCYEINSNVMYEIGTEEGIRPFDVGELEQLVLRLRDELKPQVFQRIRFLVIQCGTRLSEKQNTGAFDADRLGAMLSLCNKYGLTAKEHNGDWVGSDVVKAKRAAGLQCINIAPEFGEIETRAVLECIGDDRNKFEQFFHICHTSRKWEKWVSPGFDPLSNKLQTILISGHYVFSDPEFLKLKQHLGDVDGKARAHILSRLEELHSLDMQI